MENRLKELRKEKGETQKNIADIFGVSKMTVQRWETGESDMKPYIVNKLVNHFEVSIPYFLKLSNSKKYTIEDANIENLQEVLSKYNLKNEKSFTVDYSKADIEANDETTETPEDSYLMSLENRLANIEVLYDRVASGQEVPKEELLPYIAYVAKSVKNEIELFKSTTYGDSNSTD